MKRKSIFLRLLLLMALCVPWVTQAQSTLTVADGTSTNSYLPFYGCYADENQHVQFIYPASMLEDLENGTITGLQFYPADYGSDIDITVTISLAEVDATTLSTFLYPTMTEVWSGTVDNIANFTSIELDDNYAYGGGNLLVDIQTVTSGEYDCSGSFYGVDQSTNTGYIYYPSIYSSNLKQFLPKVTFTYTAGAVSGCTKPASITLSNLTTTSVDVTWTEGGSETSWNIYLNGEKQNSTPLTTKNYSFTTLEANTQYSIGVTAICGSEESSARSTSVTTPCNTYNLPYFYGFENADDLNCWKMIACASSTGIYSEAYEGSKGFRFYYNYNPPQYLISPMLGGTTNGVNVSFYYCAGSNYGTESFKVGYSTTTDETSAFTWDDEVTGITSTSWSDTYFYENTFPAGTKYVAIAYTAYNEYYLYIDNVTFSAPSACPKPASITVSNLTTTSVDIAWEEGGSETEWQILLGDTPIDTVSTKSYSFTGLEPNTSYTIGVAAICAGEMSSVRTTTITTPCVAVSELPYTYGFEDATGSGSGYSISQCWTVGTNYSYGNYPYPYSYYSYSGNYSLYFYGSNSYSANYSYAALPEMEKDINKLQISFYLMKSYSYYAGAITVGVMTDPNDITTFEPVATVTAPSNEYEWSQQAVPLYSYTGTGKYIAFLCDGTYNNSYDYVYIDDITVDTLPSCWQPTWAAIQSEPTATSMTLAWNENTPTPATTWDIAYGESGFDPDDATQARYRMGVTTNPYTLTGLKHSTVYGVRVRAVCDAASGDHSIWSSEMTFMTPCAPWSISELPLVENFEDNILPCWYLKGGSASVASGRMNLWSTNSMIVLPEMGVNLNMLDVKIEAAQYSDNSNAYPVQIGYLSSLDDTTTFVPVETIELTTSSYNTFTIPFGEVETDASYIAIRGRIYSGTSWSDVNIRNLEVRLHADVDTLDNAGETKALCNAFIIPTIDDNVNYSNNVNATYTLTPATEGLSLKLEGTYDLEAGDTLTVYHGMGANKVFFKKVSGTGNLVVEPTCTDWKVNNGLTLVFTTNASNTDNHEGFRLLATCVCPTMGSDSTFVETHTSYTFIMEGDEPGTTTTQTIANHAYNEAAADVERKGNQALNTVWHSTVQPDCDSLYQKVQLLLHPDYTLSISDNLCEGTSYPFIDGAKTVGGEYTATATTIYGADSVVTLNLQQRAKPTSAIQYDGRNVTALELCEGTTISLTARSGNQNAVFEWEDASTEVTRTVTPTANVTYSVVAMDTIYGCYSDTAFVNITTTPVAAPHIVASDTVICAGESTTLTVMDDNGLELTYSWTGGLQEPTIEVTPESTTTYKVTATTAKGCAAIASLDIEVNELPVVAITASASEICLNDEVTLTAAAVEGNSYAWNATAGTGLTTNAATVTPASAGNYKLTVTVTDANGCENELESPVVTVRPSYEMNYEASACISNLPYTFGTQSLMTNGNYDETFTIAYGCDSLVHLAFTVQDTAVNNYYREYCQGTEFSFGDTIYAQNYTATESTVISYINDLGECPVKEVLNVTVHMPAATSFEATSCDSYTWNDSIYTTTGSYEQTLKTSHNCDSVVTLALTVNYSNTGIDEQVPCDSLTWIDGITYSAVTGADAPTFTVTNAAGCDSVVTLNITAIRHATEGVDAITWCDTRSYTWIDNEVYTMSELDGNIKYTLPGMVNAEGCDTTAILMLTFNLANDTLNWVDTTVCDEFLVNTLLCDGTSEQVSIRDSGDYQLRVLDPVSGNPVIARYHVNVNQSAHWTTVVNACLPYDWDIMDKTNSYVVDYLYGINPTGNDTLISYQMPVMDGCADIQTLYLHGTHPEQGVEEAVVCKGETYKLANYDLYLNTAGAEPGTHEINLTNDLAGLNITIGNGENGCQIDSILLITVLPRYSVTLPLNLCESDFVYVDSTALYTYTLVDSLHANQTVELTYAGELTDVEYYGNVTAFWKTNDGCDSIVDIYYTVYPNMDYDTVDVCGSYRGPDGETYQESKEFAEVTGRTTSGCDITLYTYYRMHQRSLVDVYVVSTDPYTWVNGETYTNDTANVMYNYVVGGICDSTVVLHLDMVDTILQCAASLPYETGYGFTIEAGEVSATYANSAANGNDTIISYVIDPGIFNVEDTTVCDSYTWHGTEYTESDSITYSYTNANGCPSMDTLALVVKHSVATSLTPTVCDSYFWVDSTYEASTVVTKTFEAANECDSVVTMTLTINKHVTDVQTIAACESYDWNEVTYTVSGAYAAVVTDSNTCVGVDSLYLTINHAVTQDSDFIVNAATYTYADDGILRIAPFDTVYTYFFEGGDVNGCDSTLNVHLWLQQGDLIGDTVFSCGNYTWINGHIYSFLSMSERIAHGMAFYYDLTDQEYVTVFPEHNIYNNDGSLRETHVLLLTIVEAQYADSLEVTFPLSQEVLTYTGTSEGTTSFDFTAFKSLKKDTLVLREVRYPAISYCDSIVPLKITLKYNYDTTEATVCGTEATYAFNGKTFDLGAAGTQTLITDTLNKGEATEWVSSVNVTRKAIVDSSFAITACDQFVYDGNTYTTNSVITDTLTAATVDGCDSIIHITLTVNHNTNSNDVLTVCDSTVWHGLTYTESGDYTFAYTATNNCPSVDTLHLTVNKHITDTTVVVCDTYTWYASGETYTESADTVATYVDHNGCSGTTTLHLTVNHAQVVTDTIISTDGSYRLYGVLYLAEYEGDIDSMHQSTVTGCDSLYRVHLVVTHYQYVYENAAACGVYTWSRNNKTYGWISATESAANGNALYKNMTDGAYVTTNPTDTIGMTIYMLNLTLSEAAITTADTTFPLSQVTLALGDSTFDYSTQLAAKANADVTEMVHFGSTYYCDSIVTYTVHLVYNYDTLDDEVVCFGEKEIEWNDNTHTLAVGNNEITEVLNAGTVNEQVVTRHIMRRDTVGTEFPQEACDSYTWEGNTYTTSQNVQHVYTDVNGCDSVVTMMLTIKNNSSHGETPAAACESYTWHGETYTSSGDYTYAYNALNGCPSVDTLHLTVNYSEGVVIKDTACDSYTWTHRDNSEESWSSLSGDSFTSYFAFTGLNGCPAQDTLMLTVRHATSKDSVLFVSSGSYIYNDTMIIAGQTKQYYYHYTNAQGCDSLFHLTINVGTANYVLTDTTVCDHFTWINGVTYEYSDDAIAAGALYADGDGNYITSNPVYIDSLGNVDYDTIYILSLHLTQRTTSSDVVDFNISHNTLTYGDSIFDFTAQNTTDFVNTTINREVHFASQHYCDSVVMLTINLINNHVVLPARDICVTQDSVIVHGEEISTFTTDYDNVQLYDVVVVDTLEDMVYHQTITQHPVAYATERRDACDSYTWNGTTFNYDDYAYTAVNDTVTISGATAMLKTSYGCDSVVTLVLTLKHNTSFEYDMVACDSLDWASLWDNTDRGTLATSGIYTYNFVNEFGCQSVETMNLTLDHSYANVIDEQENCDSYTWPMNGITYTESVDTPSVTLYTAVGGCDSVIVLNLTINKNSNSSSVQEICDNEEVIWNGSSYNTTGTYTYAYENTANGCPSVDTLYLTVHPTYTTALVDQVVCDSYEWYGETFTESAELTKTFESVNGCDSIFTMNLTVNNTVVMPTETVVECETYTWAENGMTYTESGIYYDTLAHPVTGCDSIHVLDLTIGNGRGFGVETITNCGPFTWTVNGEVVDTFTESIETSTNFTSPLSGCDSVVYLRLTVNPLRDTVATLCETELPFSWRGHDYTTTGVFTDTEMFTTNDVCDSAVRLTVTVNPTLTTNLTDQICLGLGYERYDFSIAAEDLAESGEYTFTKELSSTVTGCDSIVTLTLTVGDLLTETIAMTACDSYDWNGETYTTSGTYTQEFTTAGGCDSIATMTLTINNNSGQSIARTGCYTYDWHGVTYDSTGVYTFDYVDANNCPSTDTLVLTISTSTYTKEEVVACDSYVWNNTTYTEDGTYIHENTIAGCQGVDTLVLTLNHSDNVYDIQTACGSYDWNNDTYTQSGVYTGTLTNVNGCDSVVNLVLTITQPVNNIVTATACDSYTWIDGQTYTASTNTPSVTLTAANGCDSILNLNLTIYNSVESTITETACVSYTWNGATYTTSGDYTQNYLTANGCDSIVTLSLTITPAYSTQLDEVACGSYTWNGITYTTSGNYVEHFNAVNGCDSVVTLTLTVNQPKTSTLTATACGSYTWGGTTYTTSGNYTKTYTAANGCDSVVTLALTIHNATTGTMQVTACDSYTWMNGTTYTASTNTPTVTLFNQYGCDSVVTLNLTINNSYSNTINQTACSSYQWNGTTYTESGIYTYEGTTVAGCDSTVTLNLVITPATTNTITATVCGSYTWNGITYTETGNYSETYTAANGCDSIVTLQLTVNESSSSYTEVQSCDSYSWNGNTYTASGIYVTTTTDVNGCPSIDTLDLTISNAIYLVDNQTACDSYTWIDGVTYTASTNTPSVILSTVAGCDSVITLNLTVNSSDSTTDVVTACGSYIWIDGVTYTASTDGPKYTLTNVYGCDSVVTLNLTIGQASVSTVEESACDVFIWVDGNTYTESTNTPTYTYSDVNGCDSVVTLHLTINHSVEIYDTITVQQSELPYDYNGISITAAGDYEFNGYTANGCDSTVYLTVYVNAIQGVDVVDVLNDVNVYPNPTRGRLTISVDNVEKVEVLDIVGRRVATFENTNTFDISNLGEGAYTLRITLPEGVTVRKVVKK